MKCAKQQATRTKINPAGGNKWWSGLPPSRGETALRATRPTLAATLPPPAGVVRAEAHAQRPVRDGLRDRRRAAGTAMAGVGLDVDEDRPAGRVGRRLHRRGVFVGM